MSAFRITTNGIKYRVEMLVEKRKWWRRGETIGIWMPLGRNTFSALGDGAFFANIYDTLGNAMEAMCSAEKVYAVQLQGWQPVEKDNGRTT